MKRIAFIAVLAVASCGSNPGGGGIADEDYFPHQIAFSWEYDRTGSVDTLGVEFSVHGNRLTTVTSLVEDADADLVEMTSAGSDTVSLDSLSRVIPLGGVSAFRMDEYGVWAYTDTLMTDSLQLVRFPLLAGDTWAASPDVSATVIAMDETVTVPDGTFQDVLHIATTEIQPLGNEISNDYWYAPGVGCVRHTYSIEGSAGVIYELSEDLTEHFTF